MKTLLFILLLTGCIAREYTLANAAEYPAVINLRNGSTVVYRAVVSPYGTQTVQVDGTVTGSSAFFYYITESSGTHTMNFLTATGNPFTISAGETGVSLYARWENNAGTLPYLDVTYYTPPETIYANSEALTSGFQFALVMGTGYLIFWVFRRMRGPINHNDP